MTTVDTLGTFKDAIAKSNPHAKKLSIALRKLIAKVYPSVFEVPWPKLKVIGYGIGPKKSTDHFCYIAPYGSHVNLGFNFGINLRDPKGMLEGGGKKFRHVKIGELKDVERPDLESLLREAVKERQDETT